MRPANPHRLSFTAPARSVASVSAALPSLLQPVPHSPAVSDRARSIFSSGDSLHSFVKRKNMAPGSLMKAIIRPAHGAAKSAEGDQVIFHCTTWTLDGVIVDSTRSEHGGKGNPLRLGKGKMILGFSEGIPTMFKGEVAMFKKKPEVHYAEAECPRRNLRYIMPRLSVQSQLQIPSRNMRNSGLRLRYWISSKSRQ